MLLLVAVYNYNQMNIWMHSEFEVIYIQMDI